MLSHIPCHLPIHVHYSFHANNFLYMLYLTYETVTKLNVLLKRSFHSFHILSRVAKRVEGCLSEFSRSTQRAIFEIVSNFTAFGLK